MAEQTKPRRKRKVGRRKGHRRKRFEQTFIGYFLQHEAPVEYRLLMEVVEALKLRVPSADLIEALGYASDDEAFHKARFWRCLQNYKRWGVHPPKTAPTSVKRELFYVRQRMKKYR